ncbi:restriction endonuclease [Nocardia sp. NPDC047648]|uniref:restriction endonuclease n=1 Tax=Nocardia sp. NPDC047648 TaxID=3155625 RepID=UPI0033FE46D1
MADFTATIRQHLAMADDRGNPPHVRGRACEMAVAHMFRSVPGCETELNQLDYYRSSEVDLIVSNDRHPKGLRLLPEFFLVECKHYTKPVTSMVVRDFRAKIQDRNCDLGVLLAANGVTGNAVDRRAAYHAATCALNQQIEILLLTRDDLAALRSSADVVRLLHERRRQLKSSTTFPDLQRPRHAPSLALDAGQLELF